MTRFGIHIASVALALTPAIAQAQTPIERYEAVTVAMGEMMNQALEAEIPALEGQLPPPEWDAAMRGAYTCMFDAYVDIAGEAAMIDTIAAMEASLATLDPEDLLEGAAAIENPQGISDDQALEIASRCRLMEVFMERMAASGAIEVMMSQ